MKTFTCLTFGLAFALHCSARPGWSPLQDRRWERAELRDVALEYRLAGKGDVVVLIHGGLLADGLEPLARALATRHRVLYWHRVGYSGSSPAASRAGIASQAAQLAQLMDHLKLRRAHVVGHSSGGLIALQLALDHPERVRSLVLLEPAIPIAGAVSPGVAQAVQLHQSGDTAGAVEAFMRAVAGEDWRQAVDHALPDGMAQALGAAGAFFEQELPAVRAFRFGAEEARRIRARALAVLGGKSAELSPIWQQRQDLLISNLREVEAYVVPDARHWLALEQPQAVAQRLAEFFASSPSAPR